MNKQRKKLWYFVGLILIILMIAKISLNKIIPIQAKSEDNPKIVRQVETKTENTKSSVLKNAFASDSHQNISAPVANKEGLEATPKVLILGQNEVFPNLATEAGRNLLFSNRAFPDPSSGASYIYVDQQGNPLKPTSAEAGFQIIYVEITENHSSSSIRVPIPVTITTKRTTILEQKQMAFQSGDEDGKIILYPEEVKNKKVEQLKELVREKTNLQAWQTKDGTEVPVTVTNTTINPDTVGTYQVEFEMTLASEQGSKKISLTKEVVVFGAMLKSPYYFTVKKDAELKMGQHAEKLFSKYQTVNNDLADDATFEWVADQVGEPTDPANKFDSSEIDFHWGYVKMTEKTNAEISTVIPVPIMVTSEENIAIVNEKAGSNYQTPFLNASEIRGKSKQEILAILTNKLSPKARRLASGENLAVKVTDSSIDSNSRGSQKITLSIGSGNEMVTYDTRALIFPDGVFEGGSIADWQSIPLNSTNGTITNPINGSKAGFPRRGITSAITNELGFIVNDSTGKGYVYNNPRGSGTGKVTDIPGVNNQPLYVSWDRTNGLGWDAVVPKITEKYFLRKGNELKEILVDQSAQVMYVYNLSLSRNLNFSIGLDMYNVSSITKKFSMIESVDTDYYDDFVPIKALGNNSGFYMEPASKKRFTIKLKDAQGNWLSEYRKYLPVYYGSLSSNLFGNDFSGTGSEVKNYTEGTVILPQGTDSGYQLGAAWKDIAPDEALKTGYEMFAGEEMPYMQLKANPEVFSVYQDYTGEFKSTYKLSKIPTSNEYGTIYITYPDTTETTIPFTANSLKEFDGTLMIPRNTLSDSLNPEQGSIKEYKTSMIAIDEAEGPMKGLPSNDYAVNIKVYHLGGKPIAQTIKKDSVWNKTAQSLIKDPVVLPGHTANFTYVNPTKPVNTSSVGLQFAEVRMTDINEPTRTTIIKVPVMVVEGTPPTSGLMIAANDFSIKKVEVADYTNEQIKTLILDKSEAVGWDLATGLGDGVTVSVNETTLTNTPIDGRTYSATIQAKKDSVTKTKTIQIGIIPDKANVKVDFLDENNEEIAESIVLGGLIGSTIDLSEIASVQQRVKDLEEKHYELVQAPEDELEVPIVEGDSTVSYQFKGTLFIESFPTNLSFGDKYLTQKFIKAEQPAFDQPLIVKDSRKNKTAWTLSATLEEPLTSEDSESEVLPRALWYKNSQAGRIQLLEGEAQPIETGNASTSGEYNISNSWKTNNTGFELNVFSNQIIQKGKYHATVLWQIGETP